MKKILAITLVLVALCSLLTACGGAAPQATAEVPATQAPAAEAPAAEEAGTQPAEAAGNVLELPVRIENRTGVDIHELYASGQNQEAWGEDLLGADGYLGADTYLDTTFNIDADSLKWDLMMKDAEGTAIELYGLDFTECSTAGGTVVLEFDGENGTATLYSDADATAEGTDVLELEVEIQNKTGVDIHELYASGQNQQAWGEDILGAESYLADGDSINTAFYIDADSLQWDLMMKDAEGTAIELYGLDFTECSTAGGTIVLEFDGENGTATLYSK